MQDDKPESYATVTERDMELGREACAALARATWFAEYLERKFAAVRAEEREWCLRIIYQYSGAHSRELEEAIRAGR